MKKIIMKENYRYDAWAIIYEGQFIGSQATKPDFAIYYDSNRTYEMKNCQVVPCVVSYNLPCTF